MESDLSRIDEKRFKKKNKRFWKPGQPYYEVRYQVKVVIGSADLRFELCKFQHDRRLFACVVDIMLPGFDGQKISKDNSIKVEWAPSTAPSTAVLEAPPTPLIEEDGVLQERRSRRRLQRVVSTTPPATP